MTVETIVEGNCPKCGVGTRATIKAHYRERWDDDTLWTTTDWNILKCNGCSDQTYVQKIFHFSEDETEVQRADDGELYDYPIPHIEYFPERERYPLPSYINAIRSDHPDAVDLIEEIYMAFNMGMCRSASVLIRTLFDYCALKTSTPKDTSFKKKIEQMSASLGLNEHEKDTIATLVDAGNATAHRGWQPTLGDIDALLQVINPIVVRCLTQAPCLDNLKARIPARK
ncbi:hypothetical protein C0V97_03810 [Asaia sp. W19]|uniref:DUF4145 domain-containing protein n=1 Tax=unclassified Asaia TaxID=2685023 RepID=UPI000F8DDA2E|nr:DUF4145 domain-containing protein [Asaia sp. W19]RUT26947.1 hypothetical protein C0V97_03810 [Asaia sp. W19]